MGRHGIVVAASFFCFPDLVIDEEWFLIRPSPDNGIHLKEIQCSQASGFLSGDKDGISIRNMRLISQWRLPFWIKVCSTAPRNSRITARTPSSSSISRRQCFVECFEYGYS